MDTCDKGRSANLTNGLLRDWDTREADLSEKASATGSMCMRLKCTESTIQTTPGGKLEMLSLAISRACFRELLTLIFCTRVLRDIGKLWPMCSFLIRCKSRVAWVLGLMPPPGTAEFWRRNRSIKSIHEMFCNTHMRIFSRLTRKMWEIGHVCVGSYECARNPPITWL